MKPFYLLLAGLAACFVASCATTSLSNPGGYGHDGDLSLYGLTGRQPTGEVTESDIIQAGRGERQGLGGDHPASRRALTHTIFLTILGSGYAGLGGRREGA